MATNIVRKDKKWTVAIGAAKSITKVKSQAILKTKN